MNALDHTLDPNLEQFATENQWAVMIALDEFKSLRKAAAHLDRDESSVRSARSILLRNAAKRGYSPSNNLTQTVPDGQKVKGVSTYYDAYGNIRGQWVKSSEDRERMAEMQEEAIAALTGTLPKYKKTAAPKSTNDDLAVIYPVGDHHFGMLSWAPETGEDYDVGIAEKRLADAASYLMDATPKSTLGVIALLGDLMHYDSFAPVTPTSKNMLDADGRFPKMVNTTIRAIRRMTDQALTKHDEVRLIFEIGNHDLASSIFLQQAFAMVYENEPRVTVDTSPKHFHYMEFGKCLLGTHHGHGPKMRDLPTIMAVDQPEAWGRTKYRYWYTGHIHHDKTFTANGSDEIGCRVESFRILAPSDAWAANKGYRAMQDMKAITLHKEFGELARTIANPLMF